MTPVLSRRLIAGLFGLAHIITQGFLLPLPAAMAEEWLRQQRDPALAPLAFDERLGLLVDAEWIARENRRFSRGLQEAHLRIPATPEGIDYTVPRQWNATVVRQLAQALWVGQHQTVLITGPTGVGKSFLVCALGHAACRRNFRSEIPNWRPVRARRAPASSVLTARKRYTLSPRDPSFPR